MERDTIMCVQLSLESVKGREKIVYLDGEEEEKTEG